MGGVTVGDGEKTKEEKEGNRYPPHVKSPLTFGVHPKRTQSKTATHTATNQKGHKATTNGTKRYQNHIHLANEKSFGHQIFIITDEI